jgi:CRISPR-associated protein Csx17
MAQPLSDRVRGDNLPIPTAYALLKLAHHPGPVRFDWTETGVNVPFDPAILARARTGLIAAACKLAAHRLQVSGLNPKTDKFYSSSETGKRIAASILFPLRDRDIFFLARMILKKPL